jgi:hypothetical protein
MVGDPRERWQLLCEQAAKEPNSAKLLAMVREINDLIDAKYSRARPGLASGAGSTWSPRNEHPGSTATPRNTVAGSTWTPRNTGAGSTWSPRNERLASPGIQAVTRLSFIETP